MQALKGHLRVKQFSAPMCGHDCSQATALQFLRVPSTLSGIMTGLSNSTPKVGIALVCL